MFVALLMHGGIDAALVIYSLFSCFLTFSIPVWTGKVCYLWIGTFRASKQKRKKQGPKRHTPWPIQTVAGFQDSCRLLSQLSQ